jgi:hypothetical protein
MLRHAGRVDLDPSREGAHERGGEDVACRITFRVDRYFPPVAGFGRTAFASASRLSCVT